MEGQQILMINFVLNADLISSNPRVTPKCPYCEEELHLYDFCIIEIDKKGRKHVRGFLGESIGYSMRMWHCPFCGKILGFSDHATG
ncbi:MAG: hypothetical protein ACFFD2_16135 [Promethearchaeota archaeon]